MAPLTIDRRLMKALSSDARIDLLHALEDRRKTVTELAEERSLSKSTVHEHMLKLLEAELVQKNENYTDKFVYYELTTRGSQVLKTANQPVEQFNTRIILMIALTGIMIVGFYSIFFYFNPSLQANQSTPSSALSETKIEGLRVPWDTLSKPSLPEAETSMTAGTPFMDNEDSAEESEEDITIAGSALPPDSDFNADVNSMVAMGE